MRPIPNLLGMWVYADDKVPRHTPPALVHLDGRYYINEADVDAFYRWEAAQRPIDWKHQESPWPWMQETEYQRKRKRLSDAIVKLAEELDSPLRFGGPVTP